MGIMSEDVFSCRKCGHYIVYEPVHTSGVETCSNCSAKHKITVQKTIIELIDENDKT